MVWLFALTGAAIGSFLNVCIDRLPRGASVITPPSHCAACGRRLTALDLIPIISYLSVKGRCRYCGASIPLRLLFVEVIAAALFAGAYWQIGLSLELATILLYGCIFLLVTVVDLEQNIIPNRVVYSSMALALLLSVFAAAGQGGWRFPALCPSWQASGLVSPGIVCAVLGGVAGFVFLLVPGLLYKKGMGFGDVKLAGFIGLTVGLPQVLVALFLAIFVAAVSGVMLVLLGRKRWKQGIPFGPFLSACAMVTLLWGDKILGWYLNLIHA